ncbi:MAG: ATP-binding protein, partial [Rickettsiales bacterium]|nr:ATP-binding protein [Rickettsiales bacterium]
MQRIAEALDRLAPPAPTGQMHLPDANAYVWHPPARFEPLQNTHALPLKLILGVDQQKQLLLENTRRFAGGFAANNTLLWGARGTGKSSLVKAVHHEVVHEKQSDLALIELAREDIGTLPKMLPHLHGLPRRFIILCDDLSFDNDDSSYKSLKSVLEGGLLSRPDNVLFYATSNRRHLLPREMQENEHAAAIHVNDVIDEKVSLSDRFGLWLGFQAMDQATYLSIIAAYDAYFNLGMDETERNAQAIAWSRTRGACS